MPTPVLLLVSFSCDYLTTFDGNAYANPYSPHIPLPPLDRDAWSKSVGESTSWIPAWSCTLKTFFACLAYSMVLGDTFSKLLGTVRNPTLLVVTGAILLPLCLLKNLKSLAPFSLLGVQRGRRIAPVTTKRVGLRTVPSNFEKVSPRTIL